MRYVLDSCIGFKWLFGEQDTDKARQLKGGSRPWATNLLS